MEGGDDIAEDDSDLEEEGEERFTSGEISQGETLTNAFIWLLISPCTQDRILGLCSLFQELNFILFRNRKSADLKAIPWKSRLIMKNIKLG